MQHHPSRPSNFRSPLVFASAALLACLLPGCSDEAPVAPLDFTDDPAVALPPNSVVLADFVMHVSPKNKTASIERLVRGEDGVLRPQSIDDLTLSQDGVEGSGPPNTVELVTNSYNAGAGNCPSGAGGTWCANVTLRHFYTRPISNAFVQVTSIDLANHAAINSDGSEFGLDDTKGLWKYTAPAATTPGVLGTSPNNDGTRDWEFNDPDGVDANIQLRVVASLHYANYTFDFSNESWGTSTDACQGGTSTTTNSVSTTMPFTFTLYGASNTAIRFNRLGQITFGSVSGSASGSNLALPSTSAPKPGFFVFWDNIKYGAGGKMCYKTTGSAPNRKFVVTWSNMTFNDAPAANTASLTFSAVLSEGSDLIDVVYGNMSGDGTAAGDSRAGGSSATVGVQNDSGTTATAEYNTENYGSGNAYAFVPVP